MKISQLYPTLCDPWDPLYMEFTRQEYWSGLSCPPPGALPNPGMELSSPTLQEDSLPSELPGKPLIEESMVRIQSCMIQLTIKGKIPERREPKIRVELKMLYDNNNTKEEVETGIYLSRLL